MGVSDASRLDGWEGQLDRVLRVVPYVSLGVSILLTWLTSPFWPVESLPRTTVLAAAVGLWMFWMVTLHPRWQQRRVLMGLYFAVLAILSFLLVLHSPLFGFFSFTGYLHAAYALVGRWRYVGVVATATSTALSQSGGLQTLQAGTAGVAIFGVVLFFNITLSTAMMSLSWVADAQAARRKREITALAEANEKLESAVAENAGLHAKLIAQAREAGAFDERQRMAREIHDTLAQGLTGIVTQLEAAEQAAERPEQWRRHVRTAARLARDSLAEARRSVHALTPQPLEAARLPEALGDVVARWSTDSGVAATLVTTGVAQPLLPEIEVALLRTAQEALANVAKHAAASRVGLTLSYMEDLVTLDVRDDGAGFDPAGARPERADGGFGLAGMRERVRRVAGTLEVESEPGAGTAISACVPAILAGAAA
ncbi:sensor histidine kinase [Luedemannella flava]|uniref:Oxygen sensor histidine kinase NreB n=1 Tax=Luedemannella flava TaxID=349316 RepID=A0ABP4Y680_9ACTN